MINNSLYWKEIKRNRKHFLIWILVISFFTFFIMSFYPSFGQMEGAMEEMMKGLPEGMLNAFGMDLNVFQNFISYYALYYGMHIMILTGIFTITLAGNIIAKEEREGTADFLLTRPIWRTEVVTSKMAVFFTYLITFFIIQISLAILGLTFIIDEAIDWNKFVVMCTYGFLLNFCFGGLGFIISLLPKRAKSVTGIVVAIVVGGFIVQALSRISSETEWIAWISPFQYADFQTISTNYGLSWWRVLVLAGTGIAGITGTYLIYRRKDIYA